MHFLARSNNTENTAVYFSATIPYNETIWLELNSVNKILPSAAVEGHTYNAHR